MTETTLTRTESEVPAVTSYGGFADAIGGIATVVLAIIALSGVESNLLLSITTIVFGAALLIHGGIILSEYAHVIFPHESAMTSEFSGGSVSAVFLAGAAGIVLGVLALLNITPVALTAIAVIVFGCALVLSSNAVSRLHMLQRASSSMTSDPSDWHAGSEILAAEMASGSAGVQALAGLAVAVLGILAVVGMSAAMLTLVALLILGATVVLTGSALSGAVLSFMRPSFRSVTTRTAPYGTTSRFGS
jgi:hypothetical protein